MKQTAVEWVKDAYLNDFDGTNLHELFDKAKDMEKQQIIDAFNEGYFDEKTAEYYYNETFKTK